ncbi:MAG: efflux RND transporter periplasmic adaptor subunit [Parashewanella sp.]
MKKWILVMLLIAVATFGSVIGFNYFIKNKIDQAITNIPEPTFPVTVSKLDKQTWQPVINAIGFIEPIQGLTIANQSSGVINKIEFVNGSQVKKNKVLLRLDSQVEQANLQSKQVQLPAAKAEYKRLNRLFRQGSVSKQQLDNTKAKYDTLLADINSLQATINRKTIRAPFAGVIGIRNVQLGQYIDAGTDIVRIEDTRNMKIRFTVPQNQLSKLTKNQPISVSVDAYPQKKFNGVITAIEPAVFYQSGLVQVQASLPNPSELLRSGMFAQVDVLLPQLTEQIVLPQSAINFTLYGNTVFVVTNQSEQEKSVKRVHQVQLEILERRGNFARVSGDLKVGDNIVTSGQIRLSNNSKVDVVNNNALTPAATMPKL